MNRKKWLQLMIVYRSFLKRAYPTMKHHNPNTPILIRECTGVEPKLWARYGQHLNWIHGNHRINLYDSVREREVYIVGRYGEYHSARHKQLTSL